MCRTVAYRHGCNHTTLHNVARCRLTYLAPNHNSKTPLCSGHRTTCTEMVRLSTPCLACEYRAFTASWEQRISTVRARLDAARQSLRDLEREGECAVDDDWNCCEDLDFADESLFSADSSLSDDSDAADDDFSDWFSFEKPDRTTSAWEAHGLLSQGQSPQRAVRSSALRTKFLGEEKVALQMLNDVQDEYEGERLRSWGRVLISSKPSPKTAREPGMRNCGLSRLRQVTNASDLEAPTKPAPSPTSASIRDDHDPSLNHSTHVREPPRRRRTEPAGTLLAMFSQQQPKAMATLPAWNMPQPRRTLSSTLPEYRPRPMARGTILRSCSLEQTWPLGQARGWLDEAQDNNSIALPDYGF